MEINNVHYGKMILSSNGQHRMANDGGPRTYAENMLVLNYLRENAGKDGWLDPDTNAIKSSVIDKAMHMITALEEKQPAVITWNDNGTIGLEFEKQGTDDLMVVLVKDIPEATVVTWNTTARKGKSTHGSVRRVLKKPSEIPEMVNDFYIQ